MTLKFNHIKVAFPERGTKWQQPFLTFYFFLYKTLGRNQANVTCVLFNLIKIMKYVNIQNIWRIMHVLGALLEFVDNGSVRTNFTHILQGCFTVPGASMQLLGAKEAPINRADYRFAPSQWETPLLCNDISHWLDASLESALIKDVGKGIIWITDNWLHNHNKI